MQIKPTCFNGQQQITTNSNSRVPIAIQKGHIKNSELRQSSNITNPIKTLPPSCLEFTNHIIPSFRIAVSIYSNVDIAHIQNSQTSRENNDNTISRVVSYKKPKYVRVESLRGSFSLSRGQIGKVGEVRTRAFSLSLFARPRSESKVNVIATRDK